jgi:hypothetical protein
MAASTFRVQLTGSESPGRRGKVLKMLLLSLCAVTRLLAVIPVISDAIISEANSDSIEMFF